MKKTLLAVAAVLTVGMGAAQAEDITLLALDNDHHVVLSPCTGLSDTNSLAGAETLMSKILKDKEGVTITWGKPTHGTVVGHADPVVITITNDFGNCFLLQKTMASSGYELSHD